VLFWSTLFGAALGFFFTDFEGYGVFLGGFVGWVASLGLRRTIRAEVAAAVEGHLASIETRSVAERNDNFNQAPLSKQEPLSTQAPEAVVTFYPSVAEEEMSAQQPPDVDPFVGAQDTISASKSAKAISDVFGAARNWLFGGNTIVRVGLVVLFVGLSFLASYAAAAGLFPVEMRLALVAVFGAGLLTFGFRARIERPNFGLALQGGGVATIYLTLFAAARLVDGFPPVVAFTLMILVCALGCALALLQRSQALAVTAFTGGFAVPLLLSTGSRDVGALFAYYTVLNVAILFIAHHRSWRVLNVVGFLSTFGVLTLVAVGGHDQKQFIATQVFLIISVLIYVVTSVFYMRNTPSPQGSRWGNAVDTTLLFGTALVGFGLQVGLVGDRPFGSAFAALAFAALYIAVAAFIARRHPKTSQVMTEAMLAIGVGFVTLAVPLALGARWTSAAWALEGVGAFWVGMRQARWLPRLFGLVLLSVATLLYLVSFAPSVASLPLANPAFMGAILIALPMLATAFWLQRDLPHNGSRFALMYAQVEVVLGKPAFLIGFAFWWLAWVTETNRMAPPILTGQAPISIYGFGFQSLLAMLAFVASAWVFQIIGRRTQWRVAIWPSAVSLIALVIGFLNIVSLQSHVLYAPGFLIWFIAIALHGRMLYLNDHDDDGAVTKGVLVATHVGGVWLATAMLADCMSLAIDKGALWDTSWASVGLLASVVTALLGLTLWASGKINSGATELGWPRDQHCVAYGWNAALPIAALVVVGALATALFASGDADPLPYIPLLNPVDLMIVLALATLELWRRGLILARSATQLATQLSGRAGIAVIGMLAFIAINTVWLRIAHQLLGVDCAADELFDSTIVQTGLAILWTTLALPLMVFAHRRTDRGLWLAGAALLGLTVAKLVLVDLNNTGGGARIIAFIAVGVLMLVVGYLAPLPPRMRATEDAREGEQSNESTPI
jgi:uncharacterized membrane protein